MNSEEKCAFGFPPPLEHLLINTMPSKLELAEFSRTSVKWEKRAFCIMCLYCFFSAAGLIYLGMHELNFVVGTTFAFLVLISGYIISARPYERKACCPACGKKLVDRYGLLTAFRHCPNCDFELFEHSQFSAAFPDKKAFPPILSIFSGTILAGAILFPICILFFWWIGIRLHGNPGGFPDNIQIIFQQIIMASAGIPVATGLLLLIRKWLEVRWDKCPVCGEKFSPNIANASGNCNRCGAVLLETLPVKPNTLLPSRSLIIDYRRITSQFLTLTMLLPLIVMIIGDYIPQSVLILLCSFFLAFAAGKIHEKKVAKRMRLSGRCPSCKAKIGIHLIPRCPHCGRRTIKEETSE